MRVNLTALWDQPILVGLSKIADLDCVCKNVDCSVGASNIVGEGAARDVQCTV